MKKEMVKIRNYILEKIFLMQLLLKFLSTKRIIPKLVWRYFQPIGKFKLNIKGNINFIYYACNNDQLARSIIWTNFNDWENKSVYLFLELAKKSKFVFDVGAYTGIYSLVALASNIRTKVKIFEPNAIMIPNIEKNIVINGYSKRVKIYNIALSNENGSLDFAFTKDSTASGLISSLNKRQKVDSIQNVNVWKLDDLLKNEERKVDLIKIDVEGNEVKTLQGMCEIIEQFKPSILIECLSEEKYNQVKNILKKYNYCNYYHIGKENIMKIPNEYRTEVGYPNFLFVSKRNHLKMINNSIR